MSGSPLLPGGGHRSRAPLFRRGCSSGFLGLLALASFAFILVATYRAEDVRGASTWGKERLANYHEQVWGPALPPYTLAKSGVEVELEREQEPIALGDTLRGELEHAGDLLQPGEDARSALSVTVTPPASPPASTGIAGDGETAGKADDLALDDDNADGSVREDESGADVSLSVSEPLPVCERTMLYRFKSTHGFGSEFGVALRVATIARHFNYSLVLDSSDWNYGDMSSYFLPLDLGCNPPTVSRKGRFVIPRGDQGSSEPSWVKKPHVLWRRDLPAIDQFIVRLWVDPDELAAQHMEDKTGEVLGSPLTAAQTIPKCFHKVFVVMAEALSELWRVNDKIRLDSAGLLERLSAEAPGAEAREASDLSIGMHVRLGDKYLEAHRKGPVHDGVAPQLRSSHADGQTLSSARIEPFVTAATSVIDSILSHERPGKGTAPAWLGRPLLVVMSDNPKTARVVSHDPQTRAFDVIGTEEATWTRKFAKRQAGESAAVAQESKEDESALGPNGFHEHSFNELPLERRIALTQTFVRDVTILSRNTDGLLFTGSSNVGRLMVLLAGETNALSLGRARSIDSRWVPTSGFL